MESPRSVAPGLELDDVLGDFRFREQHRRRVAVPLARVWPAALAVTSREVRLLGPLTAVRELPARVTRSWRDSQGPGVPTPDRSMLDDFEAKGFLSVRRDATPLDGRGLVLLCVAGRFWSPTGDAALSLAGLDDFVNCVTPGVAKAVATLEAVEHGDHTELVTETRVVGVDAAANRAFAAYWALIRVPSGLIRRTWLAAIARRATGYTGPSPANNAAAGSMHRSE